MTQPETITIIKRETAILVTPEAAIVRVGDSSLMSWQTAADGQTLASGGYIVDSLSLTILKLPITATLGQTIQIYNKGYSNFSIIQSAGQQIRIGDKDTTLGTNGSISSTAHGDILSLVFLDKWTSIYIQGNLTIV